MSDDAVRFDRRAVRLHRDRAAPDWEAHAFLASEAGRRLTERLADVRRDFRQVLNLGCHDGALAAELLGRHGTARVVQCDLSPIFAARARANGQPALAADEEALPFKPSAFDLVISVLSLHWVNDLPGTLLQIRRILKPDGLFLAVLVGGRSLQELRTSLMMGEMAVEQGVSPRVSPFVDLRDAGGLLQRAGFALPVADLDDITISYRDPWSLMRDLRGMGEANALLDRRRGATRRETLQRAALHYAEQFGQADGRLPLSVQLLFLTGWGPHSSQQQPLRPGSAGARLADALDTDELGAGDPARPEQSTRKLK